MQQITPKLSGLKTAHIYNNITSVGQKSEHSLAGFSVSWFLASLQSNCLSRYAVSSESSTGGNIHFQSLQLLAEFISVGTIGPTNGPKALILYHWLEAVLGSLPYRSLQHSSLLHQNMQAKKTKERAYLQDDITITMEVTCHHFYHTNSPNTFANAGNTRIHGPWRAF